MALLRYCCLILCCCWLMACQSAPATVPLEFAPEGDIVQRALTYQLTQSQTRLSDQLQTSPPALAISNIQVKQIEPIVVADLPAYHLTGQYNVTLTLPRQTVTQKQNPFEIYLQRQSEGKSWRLLQREVSNDQGLQWKSYLIETD
ncbi:hypothetical protein [Synechocystis sp. LKSZ1]|uniref:hypothetical protein n=1 Tax=Synechocystis sp. LKSZ1 TaxID=3144951 RepID=UPI00336C23B3